MKSYLAETSTKQYEKKVLNHRHFLDEAEETIARGSWSERINEIANLIPGDSVFEMGSGEGLLGTRLSTEKQLVVCAEVSRKRHESALDLYEALLNRSMVGSNIKFFNQDALRSLRNCGNLDTFLAMRVVYHFRSKRDLKKLMHSVGQRFPNVVLIGNRDKAASYHSFGSPHWANPVPFFFYASKEGMGNLLEEQDYSVESGDTSQGEPFVIGRKNFPLN